MEDLPMHILEFPYAVEKFYIVKSVFNTLKKYWIRPKCTWRIEKVWKF